MPWIIPAAVAASSIYSAVQGGKRNKTPETPAYITDPNFTGQQSFLKDYSQNMMNGQIPDYYKAIGEPNTGGTGNYISEALKSIITASQEQGAATGTGRNPLNADTMGALGNMSAGLQYADYNRAMAGRED